MTTLTWTEPPKTSAKRRADRLADVRQQLIERSGQWARIRTGIKVRVTSDTYAHRIRHGVNGWAGHRWEAQTAELDDGWAVYVRHAEGRPHD